MLIESYDLEVRISTHSTEHFEYEVIAHLDVDISPVLPYLNAILSRATYLPEGPALSWRHEGRNIGFWPRRIAVDHVESREEASQVMKGLVDLVNRTWARRDDLEPDTSTHPRLQPLEIYQWLPRTNCKACGEETCFSFALRLAAGQTQLERCTPLHEEMGLEDRRSRLETLLATKRPAL